MSEDRSPHSATHGAIPRDEDGNPQPIAITAAQVGDWACMLWHCWPASAFVGAVNTPTAAPRCPVCAYPLWRVKAIGDGPEDGTPVRVRLEFEEREQ